MGLIRRDEFAQRIQKLIHEIHMLSSCPVEYEDEDVWRIQEELNTVRECLEEVCLPSNK